VVQELASYIGGLLLLSGAAFSLLAAVGVLRLPDLFTRLHAASKAGVVGGGLVLLAVGVVSMEAAIWVRAVIGVLFLVLTTPISAHLLARASCLAGDKFYKNTIQNDLDLGRDRIWSDE
jgi:multicomponent Na+:H+ antiporter subunit G